MKLVKWYDEDGFLRQVYARDHDSEEVARETGVVHEPPDLSEIDWEGVQRDLHNLLVQRGLITWADVQKHDNELLSAVKTVMKRQIIALYRKKVE
jgi:hypothetical protein